jgi:hypothetical protein
MMNGHYKIGLLLMGLLALAACQDNDNTVEDHSGENAVQFQTMVGQSESYSRAGLSTGYVALPAGYSLSVQMCSKDGETVSNVGNAATYTVGTTGTTDTPSALTSTNPLYWPSSTVSYGFTASAGLDVVMADQSLSGNLISSDKLSGYSATDASHDAIAYQTAKAWNNNTTAVPLYLKHDKAEITVILKAGTGVGHDAVKYVENNTTLSDTIFSYGATPVAVSKPYTEETTIDYSDTEKNVSTTKYTAIVDPYDYYTNTSSPITRIVLDNQKYSFYSTNDTRTDVTAKQSAYNLTAGKHLTLTITIGRDGRIINVDAQIKDWTLVANEDLSTDDFGHAGTPYTIDSYDKLNIFLSAADQNTKGKIAILAQDITLTDAQAAVISTKTLNCTLNLNGKTISTPLPLFTEVSESGVLKYGVINLTAANQPCVAAVTNSGIIEKVTTESLQGHVLTKAGLVETNTGIIKECSNNIIVTSSETAIGGIAATSTGTIDACLNNAKVYTANAGTIVGGIVGTASGTVTNNSYTYGITQSQATGTLGNIIGSATSVTASGNSWPTTAANAIAGTNAFSSPFDAVIDSETELKNILSGTSSNSYRVAASFTISDDTWKDNTYTLASLLDGNNKTITTKYRLFETITGTFKNATILLSASLASTTSTGGSDGMSAVAHILNGGTIDGLTAARSASETISASNPSGLVGVATAGATIANCINKVPLIISGQGTTVYAGGIVSEATKTTISGCRNASTATITLGTNHGTITYVGGIVGVLNKDNKDTKDTTGACLVTDCTNFYDFTGCSATYIGGIVGLIGTKGSDSQCQGNWWPTGKSGAGASSESTGTIGKKNAIQPTE